jgi:hypothetical protein
MDLVDLFNYPMAEASVIQYCESYFQAQRADQPADPSGASAQLALSELLSDLMFG